MRVRTASGHFCKSHLFIATKVKNGQSLAYSVGWKPTINMMKIYFIPLEPGEEVATARGKCEELFRTIIGR